jgi:anti-anti-sigma factor
MTEVVNIEATEAFTHVAVRGNLDEVGVGQVELRLTGETVAQRKPVILDLNKVGLITSLGIGLLVSIARSLHNLRLDIVIIVGPTRVRDLLQMTNVDALIPLVETREEALSTLGIS